MKRWMLTVSRAEPAADRASPVVAAPEGTPPKPTRCENGGYRTYTRTDGSLFKNEGQCTRYAAQGGTLRPLAIPSLTITPTPGGWIGSGSGLLRGSTITVDFVYPNDFAASENLGTADNNGNFLQSYGYSCLAHTSFTLHGVAADGSPVSSATFPASC
jgi:hypothetical protein